MRSAAAPLKLAVVAALAVAARAAVPYLPLVGPPTLRVESPRHIDADYVSFAIANPTPVKTNAPAVNITIVSAQSVSGIASNAPPASSTNAEITTSDSGTVQSNQSLGDTFATSIFALPTPDLLGITPQALATYFRPVRFGTNDPIVGPFPLSFIPPMPPDKSSHAEYIVK